jgi:putative hydrolase of the HAD superfamily
LPLVHTTANALDMNHYNGIRVVFFDAAGTLVHMPKGVGFHYSEVAGRHGFEVAEESILKAFGHAWQAAPAPLTTRTARPDDDRDWWRHLVFDVLDRCKAPASIDREAVFADLYSEFVKPGVWELYPEVREVLEAVRASYRIGIVSNFDARLRVILKDLEIDTLFDHWVISSEVGADKPHPYIYECAVEMAGIAPDEALHVGDDPVGDWEAAAACGLQVFQLDRPRNSLRDLTALTKELEMRNPLATIATALLLGMAFVPLLRAEGVTREETIAIARAFAEHKWTATKANVRNGADRAGIAVQTPSRTAEDTDGDPEHWVVDRENTGVPYKWGGFDSLASFDAGIKRGKAAGDLYTPKKRKDGSAGVSSEAVGIDCSGFISQCWKLPRKYGTATLSQVARPLRSMSELRAGDILNTANAHVILFAEWRDPDRTRALFYEAAPFSKVVAREYEIAELESAGFKPLRYKKIRE